MSMTSFMPNLPAYLGEDFVPTQHDNPKPSNLPSSPGNRLPSPFVAIITGASRGIGRATAETYAAAGATGLVITARSVSSLSDTVTSCKSLSPLPEGKLKISTVALELGNIQQTASVFKALDDDHESRLDLLINNAGLVGNAPSAFGPNILDVDISQLRVVMEGNYFGRFLMMQSAVPYLRKTDGGAKMVINVTSVCSQLITMGPRAFNISEMASNRLTEFAATSSTATEDGLVFYSVHPGTVNTGLPAGAPPEVFGPLLENAKGAKNLCGCFCLWLSRERPSWLSGRYLAAAWDTDELEGKKEDIVERDLLKSRMTV